MNICIETSRSFNVLTSVFLMNNDITFEFKFSLKSLTVVNSKLLHSLQNVREILYCPSNYTRLLFEVNCRNTISHDDK